MRDDYKNWQDEIFQKIDELAQLEMQRERGSEEDTERQRKLIEKAARHLAVAWDMTLEEARSWVIGERKKRGLPT